MKERFFSKNNTLSQIIRPIDIICYDNNPTYHILEEIN